MGEIAFVQYVKPKGRTKTVYMPVNNEVVLKKVEKITKAGLHFEIKVLPTGDVYATITDGYSGERAHVVGMSNIDLTIKLQKMILDFDMKKRCV